MAAVVAVLAALPRHGRGTRARQIVLDFLLEQHRHRVNDLLARNAVDAARRHWNLVRDLPARAAQVEETLGRDLADRIERFREELATEYLLTTREAMRFGAIPEGWRADYDKGLSLPAPPAQSGSRQRIDCWPPSSRSATIGFSICITKTTPRRCGGRSIASHRSPCNWLVASTNAPAICRARAALSDFWKFRGFLAADREQKAVLYREALRFNPANNNVRDLLAELTFMEEIAA